MNAATEAKSAEIKPAEAKPAPRPNAVSQPYWDALRRHKLVLQKCRHCGQVRHYPRLVCHNCYSMEVDWIEASGRGAIHSWTVAHHAYHPGFARDLPYVLAVVDLEEGVRALGQLRGADHDKLKIGQPVQVDFEDRDDGFTFPVFKI